jgi:hypothetical protein
MPRPEDYGVASHVRRSQAEASPHGRKLYYLWASSKWDYLSAAVPRSTPVGFAIVKESFHAAAGKGKDGDSPLFGARIQWPDGMTPPTVTWVQDGAGSFLHVGEATGLYVMTKVGAADHPGTDGGWIYGTVAPDGTVTSAGRVSSCMGCHSHVDDRLFGLQPTPRIAPDGGPPWLRHLGGGSMGTVVDDPAP